MHYQRVCQVRVCVIMGILFEYGMFLYILNTEAKTVKQD